MVHGVTRPTLIHHSVYWGNILVTLVVTLSVTLVDTDTQVLRLDHIHHRRGHYHTIFPGTGAVCTAAYSQSHHGAGTGAGNVGLVVMTCYSYLHPYCLEAAGIGKPLSTKGG